MKKSLKGKYLALSMLALLGAQGCQQTPRNQNGSAVPSSNNSGGAAASRQPSAPVTHLKVGDTAPDFSLTDTSGSPVKLSDFRGKKNVTLAFYVLAFTGG